MGAPCSRLWEVDAYRQNRLGARATRSFERHARGCASCRTQIRKDNRLKDVAAARPEDPPSELALRRLRARVLHDVAMGVAPRSPSRWLRVALASAVVFTALATWTVAARRGRPVPRTAAEPATGPTLASAAPDRSTGATGRGDAPGHPAPEPLAGSAVAPEPLAGSAVASGVARWTQRRSEGVERIDLEEGTLRIHVRPQRAGERFLVGLPDGELEVRGTTFDVRVDKGATTRVQVDEGVVDLRLHGHSPRRLEAPASWTAGAPDSTATAVRTAVPDGAAPDGAAPDGAAYTAAVALLREGRNDQAASAFHAFVRSYPGAPQAEDASFLEAVSLARAGHPDDAATAAAHHLAAFPGSFHRREASILVARAAASRGECGKARALLAPWQGGADAGPGADWQMVLRACDGR